MIVVLLDQIRLVVETDGLLGNYLHRDRHHFVFVCLVAFVGRNPNLDENDEGGFGQTVFRHFCLSIDDLLNIHHSNCLLQKIQEVDSTVMSILLR